MRLRVLGSGSEGNAVLVRAGEVHLLVDAGLPVRDLRARLEAARSPASRLDHVLVTHGHLDHARSAGILGRRSRELVVHAAERVLRNRSLARARRLSTLPVGREFVLPPSRFGGLDEVRVRSVRIPHDADPTVAFRLEHEGRAAVVVTDIGHPSPEAAKALADPHVLVLEFNHDREMLARGPYAEKLKRRIAGPAGHLSNEEAAQMLRLVAGPRLHTLVLAHLSRTNNLPLLALAAARGALAELGLDGVRVVVASQDEPGPDLEV